MKTPSQVLFERFCDEHGFNYNPIEEGLETAPDYELHIAAISVVVEVKEITCSGTNVPGDCVRRKIRKASKQIKKFTGGIKSGILVLFDRGFAYGRIDPYEIRVAMRGLEQVHIGVSSDPNQSPYVYGMSHGPKKKMTKDANTSISAVAAMYFVDRDTIKIDLYHNGHAAVPLDPVLMAKYGISQYSINDESEMGASEWRKYEI